MVLLFVANMHAINAPSWNFLFRLNAFQLEAQHPMRIKTLKKPGEQAKKIQMRIITWMHLFTIEDQTA